MTNLENHKHQSTYNYSLTIKRFLLSAIVAYLGLMLSAFVYVPFGQQIITFVHSQLNGQPGLNETTEATKDAASARIWQHDIGNITTGIGIARLQNQMYAYTVTNQIVGTFLEVGLPYVMRFLGRVQGGAAKGKRVDFKDEGSSAAESSAINGGDERKEERELLVRIRKEVALGRDYDVFEDYLEMTTQFGYVVIWSTIWPLASGLSFFEQLFLVKSFLIFLFQVMALVNNYVELRSDAFKVSKHVRRPIPVRTDSIGPWLECLKNLTWIAALMNPALVYMFNPRYSGKVPDAQSILEWTVLIALLASHEFLFTRWAVRFVINRVFWRGSEEQIESERIERQVKDICLSSLKRDPVRTSDYVKDEDTDDFWKQDEGLDELQKVLKDA